MLYNHMFFCYKIDHVDHYIYSKTHKMFQTDAVKLLSLLIEALPQLSTSMLTFAQLQGDYNNVLQSGIEGSVFSEECQHSENCIGYTVYASKLWVLKN